MNYKVPTLINYEKLKSFITGLKIKINDKNVGIGAYYTSSETYMVLFDYDSSYVTMKVIGGKIGTDEYLELFNSSSVSDYMSKFINSFYKMLCDNHEGLFWLNDGCKIEDIYVSNILEILLDDIFNGIDNFIPKPSLYIGSNYPMFTKDDIETEEDVPISIQINKRNAIFTHIVNGKVDPYTGAIYGRAIYTDQLTDGPATDLKDVIVNSDGTVSSGAKELGATTGNGFDALQQNQTELYEIEKQSVDGVKSKEDMLEISKKTLSSSNNANYNLFNRAGTRPTKLKNDQYGFCAIIDKKYVPYRNRNSQISNVGYAVLVQGYDISEERIGDELENYSFSASQKNANTNGRRKRYITVAGAATESNQVAVDDIMKYNANGNIELKDTVKNVAGENEVIEMETEKPSMNRTGVIVN